LEFYTDHSAGMKISKEVCVFIGTAEIEKSLKDHRWPGYVER